MSKDWREILNKSLEEGRLKRKDAMNEKSKLRTTESKMLLEEVVLKSFEELKDFLGQSTNLKISVMNKEDAILPHANMIVADNRHDLIKFRVAVRDEGSEFIIEPMLIDRNGDGYAKNDSFNLKIKNVSGIDVEELKDKLKTTFSTYFSARDKLNR